MNTIDLGTYDADDKTQFGLKIFTLADATVDGAYPGASYDPQFFNDFRDRQSDLFADAYMRAVDRCDFPQLAYTRTCEQYSRRLPGGERSFREMPTRKMRKAHGEVFMHLLTSASNAIDVYNAAHIHSPMSHNPPWETGTIFSDLVQGSNRTLLTKLEWPSPGALRPLSLVVPQSAVTDKPLLRRIRKRNEELYNSTVWRLTNDMQHALDQLGASEPGMLDFDSKWGHWSSEAISQQMSRKLRDEIWTLIVENGNGKQPISVLDLALNGPSYECKHSRRTLTMRLYSQFDTPSGRRNRSLVSQPLFLQLYEESTDALSSKPV